MLLSLSASSQGVERVCFMSVRQAIRDRYRSLADRVAETTEPLSGSGTISQDGPIRLQEARRWDSERNIRMLKYLRQSLNSSTFRTVLTEQMGSANSSPRQPASAPLTTRVSPRTRIADAKTTLQCSPPKRVRTLGRPVAASQPRAPASTISSEPEEGNTSVLRPLTTSPALPVDMDSSLHHFLSSYDALGKLPSKPSATSLVGSSQSPLAPDAQSVERAASTPTASSAEDRPLMPAAKEPLSSKKSQGDSHGDSSSDGFDWNALNGPIIIDTPDRSPSTGSMAPGVSPADMRAEPVAEAAAAVAGPVSGRPAREESTPFIPIIGEHLRTHEKAGAKDRELAETLVEQAFRRIDRSMDIQTAEKDVLEKRHRLFVVARQLQLIVDEEDQRNRKTTTPLVVDSAEAPLRLFQRQQSSTHAHSPHVPLSKARRSVAFKKSLEYQVRPPDNARRRQLEVPIRAAKLQRSFRDTVQKRMQDDAEASAYNVLPEAKHDSVLRRGRNAIEAGLWFHTGDLLDVAAASATHYSSPTRGTRVANVSSRVTYR